jgi:hypothetical protein
MNKEYYLKETNYRTTIITDNQIKKTAEWIETFVKENHVNLSTKGIKQSDIYEQYCKATNFPLGRKSFKPMLHMFGLESTRINNAWVYVIV